MSLAPPIFDGWNPTHKNGNDWGIVYYCYNSYQHYYKLLPVEGNNNVQAFDSSPYRLLLMFLCVWLRSSQAAMMFNAISLFAICMYIHIVSYIVTKMHADMFVH